MARGTRVPTSLQAKFRAKYLETGSISAAARAVKMPVSTAADYAKQFDEDPEFVSARKALYDRHLPEAEALMMDGLRAVHQRVLAKDPSPRELAKLAKDFGLKSFSYTNPKPQYFRGMVDAVGKLTAKQRFEAEKRGEINTGPAVVIQMPGEYEPEDPKPAPSSENAAPPAQ